LHLDLLFDPQNRVSRIDTEEQTFTREHFDDRERDADEGCGGHDNKGGRRPEHFTQSLVAEAAKEAG
jgi:hypothetical protein